MKSLHQGNLQLLYAQPPRLYPTGVFFKEPEHRDPRVNGGLQETRTHLLDRPPPRPTPPFAA